MGEPAYKEPQGPEKTPKQLLDSATEAVASGLEHVNACIVRTAKQLDDADKYDTKLGSHLAYMTEHATQILDGLRKLEAHDRTQVKSMTQDERDELVAQYILEADVETRRKLTEIIEAANKSDGVL